MTRADDQPLEALVAQVVDAYHAGLRAALPPLDRLSVQVARAHGEAQPYLWRITALVQSFRAEIEPHMDKEEQVLFPLIVALEQGSAGPLGAMVTFPLEVIRRDHAGTTAQLTELRALMEDHALPADASRALRLLYHLLAELEAETRLHLALEEEVLFPRARALAAADPLNGGAPVRLKA